MQWADLLLRDIDGPMLACRFEETMISMIRTLHPWKPVHATVVCSQKIHVRHTYKTLQTQLKEENTF